MVVESIDSAAPTQPSKLRVPGSIPGAPTTKPLEINGEDQTPPGPVEDVPSAIQGLSGAKLRNNCGSQPTPALGWRSMASAPRDGSQIIVRVDRLNWFCQFQDGHWWIDEDFGHCNENEIAAWAPIPEWTGEVPE